MRPQRAPWVVALIALGAVPSLGAGPDTTQVLSLIAQGRHARAYAESLRWGPTPTLPAGKAYLRAYAAYHSLALDDARVGARRAWATGYARPGAGWPTARELDRRLGEAATLVGRVAWSPGPGGTAPYRASISASPRFADEVLGQAERAHGAAVRLAFGAPSPPSPHPPLGLFLFASSQDARRFLDTLGLRAPTTGSAASLGLGILMWEDLGGRPACPSPYSSGAALAHETVHAFQALLGLEAGPQWLTEGSALIAEDLVDPNHRIQTMVEASRALAARPDLLSLALRGAAPATFALYPGYYLLATAVLEGFGARALGILMDRAAARPGEPLGDALMAVLGVTPADLVARARSLLSGEEAALTLAGLARSDLRTEATVRGLQEAANRWPHEPYLAYLTAASLVAVGRGADAWAVVRALEDQGYLGCVEGTVRELRESLGGSG